MHSGRAGDGIEFTNMIQFIGNGFKAKDIETGIELEGYIQVLGGISIKDQIVQNAQYLMDSESFIKSK